MRSPATATVAEWKWLVARGNAQQAQHECNATKQRHACRMSLVPFG